ncbi:MAG TPA: helix-turn-helix domain-containing protein [Anaerolineaceae bacterium]|nr:helix-turn-helix domain-containing protein [Anaerolineaceae bacterium]HPN50419.1 helix-turn-helix domain-containing protein [Anaerolineaceae bacterium]
MVRKNAVNRPERILDAAASLITRLGFDKTTIADIALEAGVAKGAVYLHWSSKEALFDALVTREMRRLMADLLARVEADPRGGSLTRMYAHSLQALQANPLMRALYTQDSRVLGKFIHQQDPRRYVERFGFGKDFIIYMQAAGLVRKDLNPESLAYLLSVIAYGFTGIESVIPAAEAPSLEQVEEVLEAVLGRGMTLEDGDSEAGKQALRLAVDVVNRQYDAVHPDGA